MRQSRPVILAIVLAAIGITCYPIERSRFLTKTDLRARVLIYEASKVHLHDGSVLVFADGFGMRNDSVVGYGPRYSLQRRDSAVALWQLPLDSVIGMGYFDKDLRAGRVSGGVVLGAATGLAIGLGLKVTFGSCPTVYTFDGDKPRLEAECFSYSIGSMYELPDLDRLEQRSPSSGRFTLRILNEALETHYIDRFRMAFVDHPIGTEAFATDDGDVLLVANPLPSPRARDSDGRDVTSTLRYRDNIAYSIDTARIRKLYARGERDWIELTIPVDRKAEELTLALRGRNTLENTILLYDVMMRDQGLSVMDWSETLNNDMFYAWRLYLWYTSMSGIEISVAGDDGFERVGRITDTGPIAWKTVAARIPLGEHGDSVRIRLSFIPDGWSVDWIGFDAGDHEQPELEYVPCSAIRGNGPDIDIARSAIADDDGEYLITYPGEWLDLAFELPRSASASRTLFVDSKGYYIEWIRPEWVRERPVVHGFDIGDPMAISQRLANAWITQKQPFEKQFHESKIPTAAPDKPW